MNQIFGAIPNDELAVVVGWSLAVIVLIFALLYVWFYVSI